MIAQQKLSVAERGSAVHEAGHALMAFLVGVPILECRLKAAGSPHRGHVDVDLSHPSASCRNRVIITASGPIAAEMLAPDSCLNHDHWGNGIESADGPTIGRLLVYLEAGSWQSCRAQAESAVRANRVAILRLADELVRRGGHLRGQDVGAAVRLALMVGN
jgi:hypothetical protein